MISRVVPFLSGAIFAAGLILGGMTQPAKVIGFLDIFGQWDASLAFVMGGAILVYFPVFRIARKRDRPISVTRFYIPTKKDIDLRLVGGAMLFGLGWGLGGFCPGPVLTAAASTLLEPLVVAGSMLAGMLLYNLVFTPRPDRTS